MCLTHEHICRMNFAKITRAIMDKSPKIFNFKEEKEMTEIQKENATMQVAPRATMNKKVVFGVAAVFTLAGIALTFAGQAVITGISNRKKKVDKEAEAKKAELTEDSDE